MHAEDDFEEVQPGLVISDISGRDEVSKNAGLKDVSQSIRQISKDRNEKSNHDKPSFMVTLSPASVKVSMTYPKGKPKVRDYKPKTAITKWTQKSRSNMVAKLLTLDYSPMFEVDGSRPVMITLTYPNEWEVVAPTGQHAKNHLYAFKKRLERHLKKPLSAVWKMEFQSRGAVHFHLFTSVDVDIHDFRQWVAQAWADIVNHPNPKERQKHELAGTAVDEGMDFLFDQPHLIGVYFSKHASPNGGVKEYQNTPPQLWLNSDSSVGRFWGCWNLKPAVFNAEVSYRNAVLVARMLRRWHRAKATVRKSRVRRTSKRTNKVSYRWVNRKPKRMRGTRGYLSVPSGQVMGELIAQLLQGNDSDESSLLPQERRQVSNLSILSLDDSLSNREFVFKSGHSFRKFDDSCSGTSNRGTDDVLFKLVDVRSSGVKPTHFDQCLTWNTPYTFGNVSPTPIKLNLVWLISKLRRRITRKPHRLSNRVIRLFNGRLRQKLILSHAPLLSMAKRQISIIYQKYQKIYLKMLAFMINI